jgi:hypothetical protein
MEKAKKEQNPDKLAAKGLFPWSARFFSTTIYFFVNSIFMTFLNANQTPYMVSAFNNP